MTRTITERLADYGVEHAPGEDTSGVRYWRFNGKAMGRGSAHEAVTLLELLDAVGAARKALVGEIEAAAGALRVISILARDPENAPLIGDIARAAVDYIERPAPPIPEPGEDDDNDSADDRAIESTSADDEIAF